MTDGDRSQRIEAICDAALNQPAADRAAFVAAACEGDERLKQEVKALLAHAETADAFFSDSVGRPAWRTQQIFRANDSRVPRWAQLLATVAALRIAVALGVYLSGLINRSASAPLPFAVYFAFSLVFALLGLALLTANRNDVRAAWLGGVFLLIGAQSAAPLPTFLARAIGPLAESDSA